MSGSKIGRGASSSSNRGPNGKVSRMPLNRPNAPSRNCAMEVMSTRTSCTAADRFSSVVNGLPLS